MTHNVCFVGDWVSYHRFIQDLQGRKLVGRFLNGIFTKQFALTCRLDIICAINDSNFRVLFYNFSSRFLYPIFFSVIIDDYRFARFFLNNGRNFFFYNIFSNNSRFSAIIVVDDGAQDYGLFFFLPFRNLHRVFVKFFFNLSIVVCSGIVIVQDFAESTFFTDAFSKFLELFLVIHAALNFFRFLLYFRYSKGFSLYLGFNFCSSSFYFGFRNGSFNFCLYLFFNSAQSCKVKDCET